MRKGYFTTVCLFLLSVGFLAAGASRLRWIHTLRRDYKLEVANPLQDRDIASELRLPMVALFTFRSLAIDYLWIRADKLKTDGFYFDALHLARLICMLQPNLPMVWDFQAWNMAYNISVAMPTPQQRWEWVRAGYELLRDEGLLHNPRSLRIYRSLAWIFEQKMGDISDDHHRYYKSRLAYEMTPLLVPLTHEVMNSSEDIAAMAQIMDDWDELISEVEFVDLIDKLKQAEPKFTSDDKMLQGLLDIRIYPADFTPLLHQVIADNRHKETFHKLDLFVRAQVLRQKWKLDPKRMEKINNLYGPVDLKNIEEERHLSLDWRLPYTHAIYWAMHGLEYAEGKKDLEELNLHRIVYHSLQYLYYYGNLKILISSAPAIDAERQPGQEVLDAPQQMQLEVFNSQDLRMFPVAYKATLDILEDYTKVRDEAPGGVVSGSANLCRSGISNLYLAGYKEMAQKYLTHLRERYPENKDYQVSLEVFVRSRMKEEVEDLTPKSAVNYVLTLLRDSFARYAVGDDEYADVREKWARQVLAVIQDEYKDFDDVTKRITIRPYPELQRMAMMELLNDPWANSSVKSALLARLRTNKPELYEQVIEQLKKQAETSGDSENP